MATNHYNTMAYLDQTGEVGSFTVFNDAITAVSLPGFLAQLTTFRAATEALLLGTNIRNTWVGDADDNGRTLPGTNLAQRENKLRVVYKDTTTLEEYEITLPTIDLLKLTFLPGGKDYCAITAGAGASAEVVAWIAAFEAIASPPEAPANSVQVVKLQFVGRNS